MQSIKSAQEWRLKGNQFFQQKKYKEALDCYTQSVLTSSKASSSESAADDLSLAYANRSAALFYMNNYKISLQDIELALDHGYPKQLHYKLQQRKGLSLLGLGQFKEAELALKAAMELIELQSNIKAEKKDALKNEVQKHLETCLQRNLVSSNHDEMSSDGHCFIASDSISSASTIVRLKYSESQGRFLEANSAIQAGSVVIQEIPYASLLLPDHYNSHCHYCYCQLAAPIPCSQCNRVLYCSKHCLQSAWEEHHSIECPHWKLLQQLGTFAWLSLRIVLKARNEGVTFQEQDKENVQETTVTRIPGCELDGSYKATYHAVCCLISHTAHHTTEELVSYKQKAALLTRYFAKYLLPDQNKESSVNEDVTSKLSNVAINTLDEDGTKKLFAKQETSCNYGNIVQIDQKDNLPGRPSGSHHGLESQCNLHQNQDICDNCIHYPSEIDFIKAFDPVEEIKSEPHVKILIRHLTHHMQQLKCNAHAITAVRTVSQDCHIRNDNIAGRFRDTGMVDSTEQVRLATAVYPTASLMNHSCNPNVIASFVGMQLTVRAIKEIKKDEQIMHCYGPHVTHMDIIQRRKALKEQYFFTCHCEACEGAMTKLAKETPCDWFTAFQCPKCGEPIIRSAAIAVSVLNCEICQHKVNVQLLIKQEIKASQLFLQACEYLHRNDSEKCLGILMQVNSIRTRVLHKYHKDLAETQDCIARCYASMGNFTEAGKYLESSVTTIERIYGEDSIELAHELHTLAQVYFNGRQEGKALYVIERATRLFTMHYGGNHESLQELKKMKICLNSF